MGGVKKFKEEGQGFENRFRVSAEDGRDKSSRHSSSRDICRRGGPVVRKASSAKFSCFAARVLPKPVCLASWGSQDTRRPAWAQTKGRTRVTHVTTVSVTSSVM